VVGIVERVPGLESVESIVVRSASPVGASASARESGTLPVTRSQRYVDYIGLIFPAEGEADSMAGGDSEHDYNMFISCGNPETRPATCWSVAAGR
jgi:hypothetical protein